jgi:AAA15 family ATPase/GTPase
MILEFGGRNFYSFKEGFEVSLRLSASCPKKISHNKKYTNVLALKGANASGKTNVLKVLPFIREVALNSFSLKPEEKIAFGSFFHNDEPTSLYIVFSENNIEYKYEIELTQDKIISEVLFRKEKRETKIIERQENKLVYTSKVFDELKVMKLRDNASLISTALQYELSSINQISLLFKTIFSPNIDMFGRHDRLPNYQLASEYYYKNPEIFNFVKYVLKKSDTGIEDIRILDMENKETGEIDYFPVFDYVVDGDIRSLIFFDQSSGVRSLYQQLGYYKIVLEEGTMLVLDEFDIHLHPDLLPMIIDFFENPEKNKNNSQLIFTTHNNEIMDLLGKYRTILVNKDQNESYLYRLDEIDGDIIRNDRPISPIYSAGKLGGKPKLQL